jgi:exosortase/archaeosortase family protein
VGRGRFLILLLVQAAAFWPSWRWAAARVTAGDGEGAALLACAAALLVPPRRRAPHAASALPSLTLPVVLTLAYAAAVPLAPPLLRALLAAAALLATWTAGRWGSTPHPAALGLVLLALPALPTAQFLLGYPLRVAAGELAARLLRLAGLAVDRQGVALRWFGDVAGERLVAIDAPCSGVQMLWTALLLALVLALLAHLSARRTLALAAAATLLAVVANALRASALFLVESGHLPSPPGGHDGIGLVSFALAAAALVALWSRWQHRQAAAVPLLPPDTPPLACAPPSSS